MQARKEEIVPSRCFGEEMCAECNLSYKMVMTWQYNVTAINLPVTRCPNNDVFASARRIVKRATHPPLPRDTP
jgi:hypothetical protein